MRAVEEELRSLLEDARQLAALELSRGVIESRPGGVLPEASAELATALTEEREAAARQREEQGAAAQSKWNALASQAREGAARGPASGREGMAALARRWSNCDRCGLCQGRKGVVLGQGNVTPRLLMVSGAPSEAEEAAGRPIVDAERMMLANMLSKVAMVPPQQVYVTHAVKCRPPRDREPRQTEVTQCSEALQEQIQALQPHIIVLMGGQAVRAVLGAKQTLSGNRMRLRTVLETPTWVMHHPREVIRDSSKKRAAFEDLKGLRAALERLEGQSN